MTLLELREAIRNANKEYFQEIEEKRETRRKAIEEARLRKIENEKNW